MSVDVKICGLSTAATLDAALDAGADFVGLVFYKPSPRNVSVDDAVALAKRARGRAKIVALFVDPDDTLVNDVIARVQPDVIQLHGAETRERLTELRMRSTAAIMKAIKVATVDDVVSARQYADCADMILFDAKVAKTTTSDASGTLPGGNGARFDWRHLDARDPGQAWMLSGGLDVDNVVDAIRQTGATAIDVSSGVERTKGQKDVELIAAFVSAAKGAVQPDQGAPSHVETG